MLCSTPRVERKYIASSESAICLPTLLGPNRLHFVSPILFETVNSTELFVAIEPTSAPVQALPQCQQRGEASRATDSVPHSNVDSKLLGLAHHKCKKTLVVVHTPNPKCIHRNEFESPLTRPSGGGRQCHPTVGVRQKFLSPSHWELNIALDTKNGRFYFAPPDQRRS